jgi:tRNA-binding EMAP/Myf-like protein
MQAFCTTCDCSQEVEPVEGSDMVFCTVCGEEFQASGGDASSDGDVYQNYVIGSVIQVEDIPKKNLKKVMIDTTGDGEANVQVVTNAKHISASWLVVVALENSVVPAGAVIGDDPDAILVKPTSVGGVKSDGMLCDR